MKSHILHKSQLSLIFHVMKAQGGYEAKRPNALPLNEDLPNTCFS